MPLPLTLSNSKAPTSPANGAVLELTCGTHIAECTAITEYIDHTVGELTLTGKEPKQRIIVHMMQRRAEQEVLDAVGGHFHHATINRWVNTATHISVRVIDYGTQC